MPVSLNKFLSIFNPATIQRSYDYLQQIDTKTITLAENNGRVIMAAKIKGGRYYTTTIIYDIQRDSLVSTQCSCPVGVNCKHGAALAQLFYEDYLDDFLDDFLNGVIQTSQSKNAPPPQQNPTDKQALHWLNEFKRTLASTPTPPKEKAKQFIYVLKQQTKLSVDVLKVKRNKAEEITESKTYTQFENIISHKIAIPKHERLLFSQIYSYAQTNKSAYYSSSLDVTHIPLAHLKNLMASGDCYWQNYQPYQQAPALRWSPSVYKLNFEWQYDNLQQNEKLVAVLTAETDSSNTPKKFHILYTEPLAYLDLERFKVGAIDGEYQANLIHSLLAMPHIPKNLMQQVNEALQIHPLTKTLAPAKSIQEIPHLYGQLTPILRFGGFETLNNLMFNQGQSIAEVYFDYTGGRIKANEAQDYFFGKHNGTTVRQYRDIPQEQQLFLQLKKLVPSLQWANKHPSFKHLAQQKSAALIYAHTSDWINHLIPTNQIEALGWQVEHLEDSHFNLQHAHNIELSLKDSTSQQGWFDVGATIQDQQGNTFNLVELLATLIKHHPAIIEPENIEQLNDDGFFTIALGHNLHDLAIAIKDIKPILRYLGRLFEQDSQSIDRYEAAELLDLQHHLGVPWQSNERLRQFAQKLKQSYQQQLPTPQGFHGELRPYQQQGLAWLQFLRETEHGGILADDMGLGKTAQTLAHILMEKQAGHLAQKPALIIAPTSLMYNWLKEAQKFTPDLKVLILQGQNRHHDFDKIPQYDIVLSTYPLLARDEETLQKHQYHLLILDEAQNIKNPRAKAAQVVRQLDATHRLCLTGTPMENHLGELWSLFYFLMPGFLASQEVFNKKYRHPIEKQGDNQLRQKLVNRIKPFMLRRLKVDVAKELPAKTTIEVNIDMSEAQSKLYEAVRATVQENIRKIIAEKGFKRSQIQILEALLKLRQVCCHPSLLKLDDISTSKANSAKLEQLLEMVAEMVEEGRKILIFSQFTSMLQLIEDNLKTQGIDFVKLTGQTKKREEVITAFQSGQVPVFLISLKAGGVGLNLTAADTVIHYDPWWNPAAEDQASDRAWRIGQDKPVFVYKLITNHSIEEKILALQKNKAQLAQSILSHDQEHDIKLSEDDMMKLFETF